jgi:hypothetical protein
MRQKFTLVSLLLLAATFTFGQNASVENHRKITESGFEKHFKVPGFKDRRNSHEGAFQKYRLNSQSSMLKSAQTIKQRLDGRIDQAWDGPTSQWVTYNKDEYIYDANGNMTQFLIFDLDATTSQWVSDDKHIYIYDASGNMTQDLDYSLNKTTNQWVLDDKYEYAYDANGNVTQQLFYNKGETVSKTKHEYTYNANGNLVQHLFYLLDNATGQYLTSSKNEYSYDDKGNLTRTLLLGWNKINSQWGESLRNDYLYDDISNLIQDLTYDRNALTGTPWETKYKDEYSYDANGNMTQHINYSWNKTTKQWVAFYKEEFTYDDNGNKTQWLGYSLSGSKQWVNDYKEEYTYNNTYSFNELVLPFLYAEGETSLTFSHMITEVDYYDIDGTGKLVHKYKSILTYSEQGTTSLNDIETGHIELYPNPVSEYLNISFSGKSNSANLELFDILGHKLLSKSITNNEQLSLRNLNNGIYLYNLYIDDTRQSGKLVKK